MPDAVDMPAPVRTTTERAARHAAASSSRTSAASLGFLSEANGGGGTVHRSPSPVKSAVPGVRTPSARTSGNDRRPAQRTWVDLKKRKKFEPASMARPAASTSSIFLDDVIPLLPSAAGQSLVHDQDRPHLPPDRWRVHAVVVDDVAVVGRRHEHGRRR